MERIENDLLSLRFLKEEHYQRYQYAASFAKGIVADCACGIGYASHIILSNDKVKKYYGIDTDNQAIEYAKKNATKHAEFSTGSILSLPFEESSIDTFISLETLEHLHEPEKAIAEIRRVLKNDGVFICSVPTQHYEKRCTDTYGKNPYHVQEFSLTRLENILSSVFINISIAVMTQELVSSVNILSEETSNTAQLSVINEHSFMDGSFIAISTNGQKINHKSTIFNGMSRLDYDKETIAPLRKSLAYAEKLAEDRWLLLKKTEEYSEELKGYKETAEKIAEERLIALQEAESAIEKCRQDIAGTKNIIDTVTKKLKEAMSKLI